jgi:hydroxymethylglutaryl-CoA reductase (NADPH)
VLLLVSTSYLGLLEGSLDRRGTTRADKSSSIDLSALVDGGRQLRLGKETNWKWQVDSQNAMEISPVSWE